MATVATTLAGQEKKKTNLPMQDPYNPEAIVPLVNQQQGGATGTTTAPQINVQTIKPVSQNTQASQASSQTLQQAQQAVSQQQPSQLAAGTVGLAQQLVSNPQQGFNAPQYVQSGINQYNREAADALEAARQGLVGASGSSLAQGNLQQLALQSAEQRGALRSSLEQEAADRTSQNLINALTQGRETAALEGDLTSQNLANMLSVTQAAQNQVAQEQNAMNMGLQVAMANHDAALQTALTELQGKIEMGLQLNSQDFASVQNELDRASSEAIANGQNDTAITLQNLKAQLEERLQESAQTWSTSERTATQMYTTSERLSSEDFTSMQNYLDRIEAQAAQDKDIALTKWVNEKNSELQLQMQLNDMTQEEKMAYLTNQLASAENDKDVTRQITLLKAQSQINMAEMEKEFGYDTALTTFKGNIEKEIARGNNASAEAMQKALLEYQTNRDIEDRTLDEMRLALEEKGVDADIVGQQYSQIAELIDQGVLDPSAGFDFLTQTLNEHGIDTTQFHVADKQAQAQQALYDEFDLIKEQFIMSHPEYATESKENFITTMDENGNPVYTFATELSPEGLKAFNDYYNFTMYGEKTPEMEAEAEKAGYITEPSDVLNAVGGDKVSIGTTFNIPGTDIVIPAGDYSVVEEASKTGSRFWGTLRDVTTTYLVDNTGNKYEIKAEKSGTQGNIFSSLWAQE